MKIRNRNVADKKRSTDIITVTKSAMELSANIFTILLFLGIEFPMVVKIIKTAISRIAVFMV